MSSDEEDDDEDYMHGAMIWDDDEQYIPQQEPIMPMQPVNNVFADE